MFNTRRLGLLNQIRYVSFLIFLFSAMSSLAQSTAEANKQAIITDARKQLVAMCSLEGELFDFANRNNIKGEFVVDFTIGAKGKIITVFMVSSNPETVQTQNLVKNKLTGIQFDNIKIPKTERIKFRHTLTF